MFDTENDLSVSLGGDNLGIANDNNSSDVLASLNQTNPPETLALRSEFGNTEINESAFQITSFDSNSISILDNNLNNARNITLRSNPRIYSNWVGESDREDYYRFNVSQSHNLEVSLTGLSDDADVQLLDSSGNELLESGNYGSNDEYIYAQVLSGTYYLKVNTDYSWDNTDYDLTVTGTPFNEAGNNLNSAKNITLNSTPSLYQDWVGASDRNDYYRFNLSQSSNLDLSLTGLSDDADIRVLDSSGNELAESNNYGSNNETINIQLLEGVYYLDVRTDYNWDNTKYDLSVSATPVNDAGNNLNNAKEISLDGTPSTYSDWVGASDRQDYYRFDVSQSHDLELTLTGMTDDADIQLLDSSGNELLESNNYGSNDESIDGQVTPGTYYIGVSTDYNWDNTSYDLTVSATPANDAGNTLNNAKNITIGETTTNYHDWVGASDRKDYYRFSVSNSKNLNLSLTGLSDDADVELLDSSGTAIAKSTKYGTNSENIQAQLTSGTYYIGVYTDYNWDNTDYTLSLSTETIPVIPGYSNIDGFGLVDASSAVAQAIGRNPFANVPNLGGNDWGADLVNAPEVWSQGYTGEGVVVAVLDTGVDRNHVDLSDNIFTNNDEIAGDGIDNDNNGYVDDFYGWNFNSNSNDTMDRHSHGTHVAGTIAGVNNNFGVTGIAYDAQIMPVKVLGDNGSGSEASVAQGIRYAADNGAQIINMSLGGDIDDPGMRSAVEYAANKGAILVMASGNDGDSTTMGHYPAAYAKDWGIAVGAVDRNRNLASFTNRSGIFPLTYVTAPGASVYSTVPNDRYSSYSGTSMATPHVAGVVALMLDANPNLSESQVSDILTATATSNADNSDGFGNNNFSLTSTDSLALSRNLGLNLDFGDLNTSDRTNSITINGDNDDRSTELTNNQLEVSNLLANTNREKTTVEQAKYDDSKYDEQTGLMALEELTNNEFMIIS